jgi:hypothetical protein
MSSDLPVPASPVIKMDWPEENAWNAFHCESLRSISYNGIPLPLVRIRASLFVEPLAWALQTALNYLEDAVYEASLGVQHGVLYCMWHERYSHLGPPSPRNLAYLYAQTMYCKYKTLWYSAWSMYIDKRELVTEAVLGNERAIAIVALYAFQRDAILKKTLVTNFRLAGPCHCDRLGRCSYWGSGEVPSGHSVTERVSRIVL